MVQSSADPEWLQLRKQHQQELENWVAKREAARQNLERQANAEHARLLAKHAQEERYFWRRREHGASGTPYPNASKTQPTAPQPVAPPARAPPVDQGPVTTTHPAKKASLAKGGDNQKPNGRAAATASTGQRREERPTMQSRSQQAQPASKAASTVSTNRAQSTKVGKNKPQTTARQSKTTSKIQPDVIDLCNIDDDVLVEIPRAAFKGKSTATSDSAPARPGIRTGSLQTFGRSGQKHSPFLDQSSVKQEDRARSRPLQYQPQPCLPQSAHNIDGSASNSQPEGLHIRSGVYDTTAFSKLPSSASQPGASASQPFQHQQHGRQSAFGPTPSYKKDSTGNLSNAIHPQVQETSSSSTNSAANTVANYHVMLEPSQRTNGLISRGLNQGQTDWRSLASNEDVHMEDVPLARLNIPVAIKQLGVTENADVSLSTPMATKLSAVHLPTPSPSRRSTTPTPAVNQGTDLLNLFKKPELPPALRCPLDAATRTSQTPVRDLTTAAQRQSSSASRTINVPNLNRKRKTVDLSDDEQSNYSPSESSAPGGEKSAVSLGPPSRKRTTPAQPMFKRDRIPLPPPVSPLSPTGKRSNGLGSPKKATPTSRCPAAARPRTPTTRSKPSTPVTPTQSFSNSQDEALSTPPSKRRAAIRAQLKIQDMSEADAVFHTEDEIFQATAREMRRNGPSTADLGTRLRSMSITPVPMGAHIGAARDDLMSRPKQIGGTSAAAGNKDGVSTKQSVSRGRATESRRAARTRNIDKVIGGDSDEDEDYLDDMDAGRFTYLNGIILQAGQEKRLTETQSKAIRRREL